jgi:catechol 2,3-dioxygenase-like lactoylglutathione lyase family enzyme
VKLTLFVLRVTDLERSRAFYACLGLELVSEQHGNGPPHYSCRLGDPVMELYPASDQQPRSNVRLGLQVTKEALQRLHSSSYVREPPRLIRQRDDADVFVVRDPDENAIELEVMR